MAAARTMPQVVVLEDSDDDAPGPRAAEKFITKEQMQRMAEQREIALSRRLQIQQRTAHGSGQAFCLQQDLSGREAGGMQSRGGCEGNPICLDAVPEARFSEHRSCVFESGDGWRSVRKRPVPGQSFGRFDSGDAAEAGPGKRMKVEGVGVQPGAVAELAPSGREEVVKKLEAAPSKQQMQVLRAIQEGKSVFVTGSAGTGKSFLLDFAIRILKMMHGPDTVFVTASTGLAACALRGTTLHSFAGVMPGEKSKEALASELNDRRKHEARARWARARALIIDEISMIDGQFFDKLEYIGRAVKKSSRPFGGIQLVVTGDFFQLPPIERKGFAFEAATWSQCFDLQVELTQVFRQADQDFVSMLNEIRRGSCSDRTYQVLLTCTDSSKMVDGARVGYTKLYPHKNQVGQENEVNLESLQGQKYSFPAKDEIFVRNKRAEDMVEKLGVSQTIRLCVGAQVMLLKNLETGMGLVNGARGVVVGFCPTDNPSAAPFVKFHSPCGMWPVVEFAGDPTPRVMGPESWSITEGDYELARRTQVPLSLAWALSVHKCQGMTLDKVETDLSRSFGVGMVYVALSRVKSLEGLRLRGLDRRKIQVDPKVKMFYDELSARGQESPDAAAAAAVAH